MKFTLIAALLVPVLAVNIPRELQERTGQCGDNCARAVVPGFRGPAVVASYKAECEAYLKVTTTPKASNFNVTATTTAATTTTTTTVTSAINQTQPANPIPSSHLTDIDLSNISRTSRLTPVTGEERPVSTEPDYPCGMYL
ncbi:hypothetical protein FAUST_9319 [Fusarium austroamericanum]|uniref:Uncharacterized protein n=1 Tax=Fusarium austroamericanum TaxID=282268 RepID=A0AAN6BWR5_FUSAU|nr:hypothetical protein FAUST_9319 [Fusarium austroamericanum]